MTIKINSTLRSAYVSTPKDGEENQKTANVISLAVENASILEEGSKTALTGDDMWGFFDKLYEKVSNKWIPKWYTEKSKINTKSTFDIPVLIKETGEKLTFDGFVNRGLIKGAEVVLKCNVKENTIYPIAMVVEKDGEEYDPFADF